MRAAMLSCSTPRVAFKVTSISIAAQIPSGSRPTPRRSKPFLLSWITTSLWMTSTLELQPQWTALGIAGPRAATTLAEAGLPVPASPWHMSETTWQGHSVTVIAAHSPLVPRYEIWMERESVVEMWNALQAVGSLPCGIDAIESLRILEGIPAYSVDITAKDLPQETNQVRALHFNKGCYLGQEIVERIHSRGNVHRTFTGFILADDKPTPGTPLLAEGKPVGEITSIAPCASAGDRRPSGCSGQHSPRSSGAKK